MKAWRNTEVLIKRLGKNVSKFDTKMLCHSLFVEEIWHLIPRNSWKYTVKNWVWNISPVEQSHTENIVTFVKVLSKFSWLKCCKFTFCHQCTKKFYLVSHFMACLAVPCHTLKSQIPSNLNTHMNMRPHPSNSAYSVITVNDTNPDNSLSYFCPWIGLRWSLLGKKNKCIYCEKTCRKLMQGLTVNCSQFCNEVTPQRHQLQ